MPAASVYYSILAAVQSLVQKAATQFNPQPAVELRKLPKVGETLEVLPVLLVTPHPQPEKDEPADTEGRRFVDYRIQVVHVAAGNRDFQSNLDLYLNWRQAVRRLFDAPLLAGASQVYDTQVLPEVVIDRNLVNMNYDYSGLSFLFRAIEPRS